MMLRGGALILALSLVVAQAHAGGKRKKGGKTVDRTVDRTAGTTTGSGSGKAVGKHAPPAPRAERKPGRARRQPDRAGSAASADSADTEAPKPAPADHTEVAPVAAPVNDAQPGPTVVKPSKTKVYTFGAMDVEGKLKTPQLLYFLNRVKLELEMSAPDHRSFMKELEKTADDPNL